MSRGTQWVGDSSFSDAVRNGNVKIEPGGGNERKNYQNMNNSTGRGRGGGGGFCNVNGNNNNKIPGHSMSGSNGGRGQQGNQGPKQQQRGVSGVTNNDTFHSSNQQPGDSYSHLHSYAVDTRMNRGGAVGVVHPTPNHARAKERHVTFNEQQSRGESRVQSEQDNSSGPGIVNNSPRVAIKETLWENELDMSLIDVDTLRNIQGRQYRVLIVSIVTDCKTVMDTITQTAKRENDLGFLSDLKLVCTAITRAISALFVVGDATALLITDFDKKCYNAWKAYINHTNVNGSFINEQYDKLCEKVGMIQRTVKEKLKKSQVASMTSQQTMGEQKQRIIQHPYQISFRK